MPYTEEGLAVMLAGPGLRAAVSHLSLHSGPPTEGHELPLGIYRRRQIDLRDPSEGEMPSNEKVPVEVPEGARVAFVGFWTSPSGGMMLAWERAPEHFFAGRGVYLIERVIFDLISCER